MNLLSIAVDGPAGSGKSTVAKEVAKRLKITYLDTGAMYRMVTLKFLREKTNLNDNSQVQHILDNIEIRFSEDALYLNGENVTDEIRNNVVANFVSEVAAIESVRTKMVWMQREISKGQSIIMDGRDIGTVVLKNATNKFFLTASVEERARRRMKDFAEKEINITFEEMVSDIQRRDDADSSREIAPLKQADDAILVDTTKMNFEEVIDFIIRKVEN